MTAQLAVLLQEVARESTRGIAFPPRVITPCPLSRFFWLSSLSGGRLRASRSRSPSTLSYPARTRPCVGPGVRSRLRPCSYPGDDGADPHRDRSASERGHLRAGRERNRCGALSRDSGGTGGGPTYGWNGTSGPGGGGGPRRPSRWHSCSSYISPLASDRPTPQLFPSCAASVQPPGPAPGALSGLFPVLAGESHRDPGPLCPALCGSVRLNGGLLTHRRRYACQPGRERSTPSDNGQRVNFAKGEAGWPV